MIILKLEMLALLITGPIVEKKGEEKTKQKKHIYQPNILKKKKKKIMEPFQICIGPTIRIGQESWCLPYAGFFWSKLPLDQNV